MESTNPTYIQTLQRLGRTSSPPRLELTRQGESPRFPAPAQPVSASLRSSNPKPKKFFAKTVSETSKKANTNPFTRFKRCCTSQFGEHESVKKSGGERPPTSSLVEGGSVSLPQQSTAFQPAAADSTSGAQSTAPLLSTEQRELGERSSSPTGTNKVSEPATSGVIRSDEAQLMSDVLSTLKQMAITVDGLKKTDETLAKTLCERFELHDLQMRTLSSKLDKLPDLDVQKVLEKQSQLEARFDRFEERFYQTEPKVDQAVSEEPPASPRARALVTGAAEFVKSSSDCLDEPARTAVRTAASVAEDHVKNDPTLMAEIDSVAGNVNQVASAVGELLMKDLERRGSLGEQAGGSAVPLGSISMRIYSHSPVYAQRMFSLKPIQQKPFIVIPNTLNFVGTKQTLSQAPGWFIFLTFLISLPFVFNYKLYKK